MRPDKAPGAIRVFPQDFISEFGDLEGHAHKIHVARSANTKYFATHFPDLGAAPLNDMGCRGEESGPGEAL